MCTYQGWDYTGPVRTARLTARTGPSGPCEPGVFCTISPPISTCRPKFLWRPQILINYHLTSRKGFQVICNPLMSHFRNSVHVPSPRFKFQIQIWQLWRSQQCILFILPSRPTIHECYNCQRSLMTSRPVCSFCSKGIFYTLHEDVLTIMISHDPLTLRSPRPVAN